MALRAPALAALAGALSLPLAGCIAAAVPVAAAGGIFQATRGRSAEQAAPAPRPTPTPTPGQTYAAGDGTVVRVTSLTELPPPDGAVPVAARPVPPEMQYLYGSGEAAALSLQAYRALWNYVHGDLRFRRDKGAIRSVVLAPGSTLASPRFDLCGKRPLAIVLDVDETVLLNLGYEADAAARGGGYDAARWSRWEATGADKVAAVPGAAETLAAIRGDGLTVVFNSNRSAASATQTAGALIQAGLGPAVLGDTLWLRGEGEPSGKDARRVRIAERYCIVAMAGDQLGDFSDLFNAPDLGVRTRRNLAGETMLAPLWGAGWFMLPNPVYGTGLKGSADDVFPADKRWVDPEERATP